MGVRNVAIYSCFPAKLASFSKSGRTKDSYIKLFNIVWNFQDPKITFWDKLINQKKNFILNFCFFV